jgi:hypothetical protein
MVTRGELLIPETWKLRKVNSDEKREFSSQGMF